MNPQTKELLKQAIIESGWVPAHGDFRRAAKLFKINPYGLMLLFYNFKTQEYTLTPGSFDPICTLDDVLDSIDITDLTSHIE